MGILVRSAQANRMHFGMLHVEFWGRIMFKALFVPQGYLTLAALALLGYRHWAGDWPQISASCGQGTSQQSLSWDRQTNASLDEQQIRVLKREILAQLERISPAGTKPAIETNPPGLGEPVWR
ncbi:MAG TPA: hypothetical protein VMM56_02200 [Planctomycetaceae bacterium]|nr:hypothetical protein [Planctomycetaceae bacterium]